MHCGEHANPVMLICRAISALDDAVRAVHEQYPPTSPVRVGLDDIVVHLHDVRRRAETAA